MAERLTEHRDVPFKLCFHYPLEKKYTMDKMSMMDIKAFQNFLDKISKMTVQQVDTAFSRKPDKNDTYNDLQIRHYEVTDKFRIHVVLEEGLYKILRLDPNHKVHSK